MSEVYRVTPDSPIFNVCLYGSPGSGKTTLASSAQDHPAMADVLFMNIEGGLLSVSHRTDIHAVDIHSVEELEKLGWEIRKGAFTSVNTVILDSVSELQTKNLEQIVGKEIKENRKSRSGKVRSRDDIWQEDYGVSTTQMKRVLRMFKDLPVHFIVTALDKVVYPKTDNKVTPEAAGIDPVLVLPLLTAKLTTSLMGYMDFVWYCRENSEDETFELLTRTDGIFRAKTRGRRFRESLQQVLTLQDGGDNPFMLPQIYDLFCSAQKGQKKGKKRK